MQPDAHADAAAAGNRSTNRTGRYNQPTLTAHSADEAGSFRSSISPPAGERQHTMVLQQKTTRSGRPSR
jgi:hypothetical protein